MTPIETLIFADYNPRGATKKEELELMRSIEKFGFVEPVIVNSAEERKNIIIGGHFRVKIAKKMGVKKVPVFFISIPDIEKEKELNLRLNKNSGHWDERMLSEFDHNLLLDVGFEQLEIDAFSDGIDVEEPRIENEDDVPEKPKVARSRQGEVYQLGRHRIMCGDSTNQKDVTKLMQGAFADMVFTDPPYNVNYSGDGKQTSDGILNDKMSDSDFMDFLRKVFANYRENVRETAGIYVFHSVTTQAQFEAAMNFSGIKVRAQLIWNKPAAALSWWDYQQKHEPFFYCCVDGHSPKFYGNRKNVTIWDFQKSEEDLIKFAQRQKKAEAEGRTTVWSVARENVEGYVHPTQKPVQLVSHALRNSSKIDDIVLDLFLGSGSTLIACEKTGRVCYGMELDPKFIDVIIERWENFTGQKAERLT